MTLNIVRGLAAAGPDSWSEECGYEYQEGGLGTRQLCRCRTAALRFCSTCDNPICHVHSRPAGDYYICTWCNEEAAAAARLRAQDERQAKLKRYQSLPAVSDAEIKSFFRGDANIVDGGTHSFWDMTNKRTVDVLVSMYSADFVYRPRDARLSIDEQVWLGLTLDGRRYGEAEGGGDSRPSYSYFSSVAYVPAPGPEGRYNYDTYEDVNLEAFPRLRGRVREREKQLGGRTSRRSGWRRYLG